MVSPWAAVPGIMLTGNGGDVVVSCMQAGANDFMVKPVAADRLREKLQHYLSPALTPTGH